MQIRVELLLRARGGAWARPIELLSSAIGAGFMIFLAWYMTAFAYDSYVSGQVSADSDTPLWIPQAALALATAIFALQTVVRVFACIAGTKLENEAFKVASAAE
jgi:TRAP-type C4-dicarboxylate transport system permease small subunit